MLINLHSHLEGRLRPSTAFELSGDPRDWQEALSLDGPADLTRYLSKVAASYPFFTSYTNIERITYEAVLDAAAEGQDYLELRFGPATHVSETMSLRDVVAAACSGLRAGIAHSHMPAGLVIAVLRSPRHRDTLLDVAKVAVEFAGAGVVGFDLAGDELRYPELEPYVEAFALARSGGLGLTCHAAEAGGAALAWLAVRILGVSRIGHGTHAAQDVSTMASLREAGVVLECCPTSNWYTGAVSSPTTHPAKRLREAGVRIVLGDDNPVQTRSSLPAERSLLTWALGFDEVDMLWLDSNSVSAMFAEESVRRKLKARL